MRWRGRRRSTRAGRDCSRRLALGRRSGRRPAAVLEAQDRALDEVVAGRRDGHRHRAEREEQADEGRPGDDVVAAGVDDLRHQRLMPEEDPVRDEAEPRQQRVAEDPARQSAARVAEGRGQREQEPDERKHEVLGQPLGAVIGRRQGAAHAELGRVQPP